MAKKRTRDGGPLSPHQAAYLKALPKSKTKKEAALKAGYSKHSAENVKDGIEDRIGQTRMREAFEKAGLTDSAIAKVIREATAAKSPVYIKNGSGPATYMKTVFTADHSTRIRAAEVAGKFRGDFIERSQISGSISVEDGLKGLTDAERDALERIAVARRTRGTV